MPTPAPTPPPVLTTHAPAGFSLAGMAEGVRLSMPMVPGLLMGAGAVGAAAAERGLTLGEATGLSAFVYAGASQLLALQLWPEAWTPSALLALAAVVFAVNLRLVLMGAALHRYLSAGLPRGAPYLALASLTDANFLIGSRYSSEGGGDTGVFVGAGLFMWSIWIAATIPGHMLGYMMTDPKRFGLDLITPLLFTVMAVGLFKAKRDRMVWPIAAGVAVATAELVSGYWFIIAGALAGSIAAGLFRHHD
ncbi:Inner membrane protein YgaZ [bacterium YEK0313]|nr:Inner membrane protein YgaZ [bacterium YEK0313]